MARTNIPRRGLRSITNRDVLMDKLDEHDVALDKLDGGSASYFGTPQAIVAAGAVNLTKYESTLAIDGTTAYTLAAPAFVGQRKLITQLSGVNTPSGAVTVTGMRIATQNVFTFDRTTAQLDTAPRSLELVSSDGVAWSIAAMVGVTVA
jgi:hypothetical protein